MASPIPAWTPVWTVEILVQGYPGKSTENGGLGWSTVALARGPGGRIAVLDTGNISLRRTLVARLAAAGVQPGDVTDVLMSHSHYDHCLNWPLFSRATLYMGAEELDWALTLGTDDPLVPVFSLRALAENPRLRRMAAGEEVLPGIATVATPGHTMYHLSFLLHGEAQDTIFAADAAKNLAELRDEAADLTMDAAASSASLAVLNRLWRARPGTRMLCGHDLMLTLDAAGQPVRAGVRRAGITARLGESMDAVRSFPLG